MHTPDWSWGKLLLYLRIIFSDRLTFNKPLVLADEFSQRDGDAMGCSKPAANPGAAQEPPLSVGDLSCCHHPPGQPVPFTGCGGWVLVFLRCCRLWCSRTALHLIRIVSEHRLEAGAQWWHWGVHQGGEGIRIYYSAPVQDSTCCRYWLNWNKE